MIASCLMEHRETLALCKELTLEDKCSIDQTVDKPIKPLSSTQLQGCPLRTTGKHGWHGCKIQIKVQKKKEILKMETQ